VKPRRIDPDVAEVYHLHSSNVRARLPDLDIDLAAHPARFRTFPGAPRVSLPPADFGIEMPFGRVLERRVSDRESGREPLPLARLSQLLYLSYGVRGERHGDNEWVLDRPVPSAGGLYPVELYIAASAISSLEDGVYHYDPRSHELEALVEANVQAEVGALTIGQEMIAFANAVIVLTATFERTMWKYGQRGYRYVWLDAGHIGENLYLAATAMGLGVVGVGGFYDHELAALLGLPQGEKPLYLVCIGSRDSAENAMS